MASTHRSSVHCPSLPSVGAGGGDDGDGGADDEAELLLGSGGGADTEAEAEAEAGAGAAGSSRWSSTVTCSPRLASSSATAHPTIPAPTTTAERGVGGVEVGVRGGGCVGRDAARSRSPKPCRHTTVGDCRCDGSSADAVAPSPSFRGDGLVLSSSARSPPRSPPSSAGAATPTSLSSARWRGCARPARAAARRNQPLRPASSASASALLGMTSGIESEYCRSEESTCPGWLDRLGSHSCSSSWGEGPVT